MGTPRTQESVEKVLSLIRPELEKYFALLVENGMTIQFTEIESGACSIGDLLARATMREGVVKLPPPTEAEIQAARKEVHEKAVAEAEANRDCKPGGSSPQKPPKEIKPAEKLKMKMMRKEGDVLTMRGKVPVQEPYLYFPGQKTGIFPPQATDGAGE